MTSNDQEIKLSEDEQKQLDFNNNLSDIARKQIEASRRFKEPRMAEIRKREDMYLGKVKKSIVGRFNVPLPVLSGFVDTLMSKIDDAPELQFDASEPADYFKAMRVTSAWKSDACADKAAWARADRMAKRLSIFSGRGIYLMYSQAVPDYKNTISAIDYNDFHCEPNGGSHLEDHMFLGVENIFKSKSQLKKGVTEAGYNKAQVEKLINSVSTTDYKQNNDKANERDNRAKALKLDPQTNNYVGEPLYNLVMWFMEHQGQRYYMLFEERTGIWIKCIKLTEMFSDNRWPITSWATNEDPLNFWSKAPADDIYPVAVAMNTVFNQALDNLNKKNWGMRAYDAKIFPDPSKLKWRPDGLVAADAKGRNIGEGIYEFKVDDATNITLNLVTFLDNFLGQKTGITPSAQGTADKNTRVGVYYGDLKQVADRMGLTSKSYYDCYVELGSRYITYLKDNMPAKMMVKVVGQNGVDWQEMTDGDLDAKFDIVVGNVSDKAGEDDIKKKRQGEALRSLTVNPALMSQVSPKWLVENILKFGDFTQDQINMAFDKKNEYNWSSVVEAQEENQKLVAGKTVKPNRSANPSHLQAHLDYAYDTEDLSNEEFKRIMAHVDAEMPIAQQNMVRKAQMLARLYNENQMMGAQPGQPGDFQKGLRVSEQVPGTEGGTRSMSQTISDEMSDNMPPNAMGNIMSAELQAGKSEASMV